MLVTEFVGGRRQDSMEPTYNITVCAAAPRLLPLPLHPVYCLERVLRVYICIRLWLLIDAPPPMLTIACYIRLWPHFDFVPGAKLGGGS